MSAFVLLVDAFGLVLAVVGFVMAFRQDLARRILGRPARPISGQDRDDGDGDPLTYVLRIAGTMIMIFGIAIGSMVTLFHFR